MPTIFDNIRERLLPRLRDTLAESYRADFCVGYFNLRGWNQIDAEIQRLTGGNQNQCRLLIGMQGRPADSLRALYTLRNEDDPIDAGTVTRLRREVAAELREQLTQGAPTNADEQGLRRLVEQIKSGQLVVKLYLRGRLHAKLYLLFRNDKFTPIIGYLGSSNLTFSGLSHQGELNVDVLEQDACQKLADWFEDRWADKFCIDVSQQLVEIIEESWASEELTPPYHVYLKMAYHLSREARVGLSEFTIPRQFQDELLEFQIAAVKIAARHLNQRRGVLIGDVVGLGKTMMATALAKIFEEDFFLDTLIICPKNLVEMWEGYRERYSMRGKVISISMVTRDLPNLEHRYRLVLIDESHNLRNRDGRRYRAIRDYIQRNESRCILLSATPFNKTYRDLSNQLRLFLGDQADLGIRPESLLREIGEAEFSARHDAPIRSLEAFEQSEYPDDWRELMRLFMVRRTRSFIRENYGKRDPAQGRRYLEFPNGDRAYFPQRIPRRVPFAIDEDNPNDQYARLYSEEVVDIIGNLHLPRYGLGNYVLPRRQRRTTSAEERQIENLSRGGRRLMGFSRTNLFKRLESSGHAFGLSIERHILRNYVFLHALENGLDLPIGTQDAGMLDTRLVDADADAIDFNAASLFDEIDDENDDNSAQNQNPNGQLLLSEDAFRTRAAQVYDQYQSRYRRRFKWIRANLFNHRLAQHLSTDARALTDVLQIFAGWNADQDAKLDALMDLISNKFSQQKVLVFSQFSDTVVYLTRELKRRGVRRIEGVTGGSPNPTALAYRFSPVSNGKEEEITPEQELRVLLATDVLSEGQNLQDCAIVVNYDLPWAIIRLIQRAGRVDRIGQQADTIYCYTFWPAEGVEQLIRLRTRLINRLRANQEVVGSDERFFDDDGYQEEAQGMEQPALLALYNENAEVLDDDGDGEVDLVSEAYQIWKNATDDNPELKVAVETTPPVVFATKAHATLNDPDAGPPGVLVYLKTGEGHSALAWIDLNSGSVSHSQYTILRAAACLPGTPALPRQEQHHELVQQGVAHILRNYRASAGGQLGRTSGARYQAYTRLKQYIDENRNKLFGLLPVMKTAERALEQILSFPLRDSARDRINRQLRAGIQDLELAELIATLYEEDKLCVVQEDTSQSEPQIICSMGLAR